MSSSSYTSLEIIQEDTTNPSVLTLYLKRPTRHNALSLAFFSEFPRALSSLDQNPEVSVIILSGRGKHFCAGIDLAALNSLSSSDVPSDRGLSGEKQLRLVIPCTNSEILIHSGAPLTFPLSDLYLCMKSSVDSPSLCLMLWSTMGSLMHFFCWR
ncbi:delta(3,5)-delta(2,4)-dienoyl-CoA isomerase, peroxisomal [Tanacetum coccineum]